MSSRLPTTSRSLPIALIRARETVMAPIRQMLANEGLTEQQWRVLRVLAEFETQTATEVCDKASLLPSSFTRIAATMTEKGLISRSQSSTDRRSQSFAITPAGQQIIDANQAEAAQIVKRYKAQIGEDRYELLLDLLGELSEPS